MPSVPIVAIDAGLQLQEPPPGIALNVDIECRQTFGEPSIMAVCGVAITVATTVSAKVPQPLTMVYEIAEVPAEMPVTAPPLLTEATPLALLLHTPPGVASLSVIVDASHNGNKPAIVSMTGIVSTLIVLVLITDPQLLATV